MAGSPIGDRLPTPDTTEPESTRLVGLSINGPKRIWSLEKGLQMPESSPVGHLCRA